MLLFGKKQFHLEVSGIKLIYTVAYTTSYKFKACALHTGTTDYGHYTAMVRFGKVCT